MLRLSGGPVSAPGFGSSFSGLDVSTTVSDGASADGFGVRLCRLTHAEPHARSVSSSRDGPLPVDSLSDKRTPISCVACAPGVGTLGLRQNGKLGSCLAVVDAVVESRRATATIDRAGATPPRRWPRAAPAVSCGLISSMQVDICTWRVPPLSSSRDADLKNGHRFARHAGGFRSPSGSTCPARRELHEIDRRAPSFRSGAADPGRTLAVAAGRRRRPERVCR